jgi:hypothetical protein
MDESQAKKTCLHCEKPVDNRGLCRAHYEKFNRQKKEVKDRGGDWEEFDRLAVQQGLILPPHDNPFSAIADQILKRVSGKAKENDASKTIDDKAEKIRANKKTKTETDTKRKPKRKAE